MRAPLIGSSPSNGSVHQTKVPHLHPTTNRCTQSTETGPKPSASITTMAFRCSSVTTQLLRVAGASNSVKKRRQAPQYRSSKFRSGMRLMIRTSARTLSVTIGNIWCRIQANTCLCARGGVLIKSNIASEEKRRK